LISKVLENPIRSIINKDTNHIILWYYC